MIIIEPTDIKYPDSWSEDDIEELIGEVIEYTYSIAPCIRTMDGAKKTLAKSLIKRAILSRTNPSYGAGSEKIGPFEIKEGKPGNESDLFMPVDIRKKLMALCGQSSKFSIIQLHNTDEYNTEFYDDWLYRNNIWPAYIDDGNR